MLIRSSKLQPSRLLGPLCLDELRPFLVEGQQLWPHAPAPESLVSAKTITSLDFLVRMRAPHCVPMRLTKISHATEIYRQ